jgi:hypothetical protein
MRLKESELTCYNRFFKRLKAIFENEYQNLKHTPSEVTLSWYDWNQYLIQLQSGTL